MRSATQTTDSTLRSVAAGGEPAASRSPPSSGRSPDVDSIAILPIETGTSGTEIEVLCDGLTDRIIDVLSHLPGVRVMARATVFRYNPATKDMEVQHGSGVSDQESEAEFTYMRGWAKNIWADTLDLPMKYRFSNKI